MMLPMLKTVLSSLFKKSSTVLYPIKTREHSAILRGHIEVEIEKCIYCGICQKKCPTGAIEVKKTDSSWSIEQFKCIQCNCCAESCPKKCLIMSNELSQVSAKLTKDVVTYARVSNSDANHSNS